MDLINDKVSVALDGLIGDCFAMNRFLDRGMSLLSVKFHMTNSEKILHAKIAHAFPGALFADGISDYKSSRDCLSVYPETPVGNFDVASPVIFIKEFYNRMVQLQQNVYDCADEAVESGDLATKVFLDGLIKNVTLFIDQAKILVDIFEDYGDSAMGRMLLDANIEKYIIV